MQMMMLVGTNASHILAFSERNSARASLDLKSNVEQEMTTAIAPITCAKLLQS